MHEMQTIVTDDRGVCQAVCNSGGVTPGRAMSNDPAERLPALAGALAGSIIFAFYSHAFSPKRAFYRHLGT